MMHVIATFHLYRLQLQIYVPAELKEIKSNKLFPLLRPLLWNGAWGNGAHSDILKWDMLTHWSYVFLALSHRYDLLRLPNNIIVTGNCWWTLLPCLIYSFRDDLGTIVADGAQLVSQLIINCLYWHFWDVITHPCPYFNFLWNDDTGE